MQETGSRFANGDAGSIEAKARELEELRTERDRLAAGQQGWQDRLDAARTQLENEVALFQKEAERFQHQIATLSQERDHALSGWNRLGTSGTHC